MITKKIKTVKCTVEAKPSKFGLTIVIRPEILISKPIGVPINRGKFKNDVEKMMFKSTRIKHKITHLTIRKEKTND